MKLRSDDQEWLRTEIATQISNVVDQFKPHGLKKLAHWLREWGIIGTNITIIVALLAMTLSAAYYAFSRVGKEAAFEATTGKRLDDIEDKLKLIPARIAEAQYSTIPPKDLKAHREELNAVKTTLLSSDRNTPSYWQVSLQLVNLLSIAASYVENPNRGHSILADSSGVQVVNNGDVVVLRGKISNSLIENSVIQFDPTIQLVNVTFKKCVFIFPSSGDMMPPKNIQQIGDQLLAAKDISSVLLTAS